MKHELLDPHAVIAWDMDETLIRNPSNVFFCQYIIANPHKLHHVVTFRTPRHWAGFAYHELAEYGVTRSMIAGVHSVPDRLYHAWVQREDLGHTAEVDAFLEWKGKKAKEIGATVLIDDMPQLVLPGCEKYGITFINSQGTFPVSPIPERALIDHYPETLD